MATYGYTAHADRGTHNTQYGSVEAATPREAEKKVKDIYSYTVHVSLTESLFDSSVFREVQIMDRGVLV